MFKTSLIMRILTASNYSSQLSLVLSILSITSGQFLKPRLTCLPLNPLRHTSNLRSENANPL